MHEANPEVISLGKKLGRTTRSVESQLLMFHTCARGGDYGKMNKLCRELWEGQKVQADKIESVDNPSKTMPVPDVGVKCPSGSDFLTQLLSLQQDGREAINSPHNWTKTDPLLEIETPLTASLKDLAKQFLLNDGGVGLWYFFIGSPGNGKSAAVGKLVKHLKSLGCSFYVTQENGKKVELASIASETLPYEIEVFEKGKNFASLIIAQDASVVKDPFSSKADPAVDFTELLKSAHDRRVSLIVCANRGVIETAYRKNCRSVKTKEPWEGVLARIYNLEANEESYQFKTKGRAPFKEFKYNFVKLDNKSLLLNSDSFDKVLVKATGDKWWAECAKCESCGVCPFKLNRDYLHADAGRKSLITVLRRMEILSGQVIVFREALALVSLLLAGCPKDYEAESPCDWVKKMVAASNYIGLASRRVYMVLFAAYSPIGLELDEDERRRQNNGLLSCAEIIRVDVPEFLGVLTTPISSDVGVARLIGEKGVAKKLDPLFAQLPAEFYEKHSSGFNDNITSLEKKCDEIWGKVENCIGELHDEKCVDYYKWLSRWRAAFTLRHAAMRESLTAFGADLDELFGIAVTIQKGAPSQEEQRRLRTTEIQLEEVLRPGLSGGVNLTESVVLENASSFLKIKIKLKPKSDHIGIILEGNGNREIPLSPELFLWLRKAKYQNMSTQTFPEHLLSILKEEQFRDLAISGYAFKDDVKLRIEISKEERKCLLKDNRGVVAQDA